MRTIVSSLLGMMTLLAGCGEGGVRQPKPRDALPALNESPPAVPVSQLSGWPSAQTQDIPAEITGDGWVQRQVQMEEQVKSLRAYAAAADPDDPFALSEKRIEAFSKLDDPVVY